MGITGGERGAYVWLSEEELDRLVTDLKGTLTARDLKDKLKQKLDWVRHLDRAKGVTDSGC